MCVLYCAQHTDICGHALSQLEKSRVKRVVMVGRRGPLQASFTIKELREMTRLSHTSAVLHQRDFEHSRYSQVDTHTTHTHTDTYTVTHLILTHTHTHTHTHTYTCHTYFTHTHTHTASIPASSILWYLMQTMGVSLTRDVLSTCIQYSAAIVYSLCHDHSSTTIEW